MISNDKARNLARFNAIRNSYDGHFCDKTLVDIGCHDGWFGREFIRRGGKRFIGIDTDPVYPEFNIDFKDVIHLRFDVGFYLNLHYHGTTTLLGYVEWLSTNCKTVYTSCRRGGSDPGGDAEKYIALLKTLFKKVDFVFQDGDKIFKCE
jgi:hypothetical protein